MNSDLQAEVATYLAAEKPLLAALIWLVVLIAGGLAGSFLAQQVAPESGVTAAVSVLVLPAAFMLSLFLWQGLTFFGAFLRMLRGERRSKDANSMFAALARKAWLLVPLPIVFATFAGIVAGVLGEAGFFKTVLVYSLLGGSYGVVCYLLGRSGRLPMLDD